MALLLVGDDGILLRVAAEAYALSELIHGVDVVDPISVDGAEKLVALYLMVVDYAVRLLSDIFNLLFVGLGDFLGDLFDCVLVVPLFKHFVGDFKGALVGVDPLLQGGVQGLLVPKFGHGVGIYRLAHDLGHIVGDILEHLFVDVAAAENV